MYCTNCGSPVSPGERFCTNCGADLRAQEVASTELESSVGEQQNSAASTPDVASSVSSTVAPAMAEAKPHRHGLVIGLSVASAVVLVIAVVLSLIATNVIPNPLVRERAVTFAIKAPHYNEKTDSKIPLHITGKTSTGRVISQHVYVSPKAPVVHLAPGQYTVTVEASPLLSSGDVYRIPEPIKVDTTKDNRLVGQSKPVKQDLKFEVKPASEVTASDLQAMAKFAKKTATPVKKLDFLNEKIRRQKVATAFNSVLDMLSTENAEPFDVMLGESARYSLLDIDQDGIPELFTWDGRNGGKTQAQEQPIGCGEKQDDFSGSRVWKYDSEHDRAECLSGDSLSIMEDVLANLQYSSSRKVLSGYQSFGSLYVELTLTGDKIKISQDENPSSAAVSSDRDNKSISVFSTILDRDLLSILAMKVPSSLSAQPIENYDQYALQVSNAVMNGQQVFIGTVRLMTPQQVQDYQHQYVVDHQLNFNDDPTSTNPENGLCKLSEDYCGNPAGLTDNFDDKLMVFIPDGQRTIKSKFLQVNEPLPLYIYPISDSASSRASGCFEKDCSEKYFRNYDNKRVILTSPWVSWGQSLRVLPWAQPALYDADVLLTLSH